jgi:hypothetical protein
MGKTSKRTVKFLRTAAKSVAKGGAKGGEGSFKKGGRKKPRVDKDDILEDMEVEKVISMKNSKAAPVPEKKGSIERFVFSCLHKCIYATNSLI